MTRVTISLDTAEALLTTCLRGGSVIQSSEVSALIDAIAAAKSEKERKAWNGVGRPDCDCTERHKEEPHEQCACIHCAVYAWDLNHREPAPEPRCARQGCPTWADREATIHMPCRVERCGYDPDGCGNHDFTTGEAL